MKFYFSPEYFNCQEQIFSLCQDSPEAAPSCSNYAAPIAALPALPLR